MKNLLADRFTSLTQAIFDEIFPPECLQCNQEGQWLCSECEAQSLKIQSPTCPFCDRLSPLGKTCITCKNHSSLAGCRSFWYYKTPIDSLIQGLKYHSVKDSTRFITPRLVQLFLELPLSRSSHIVVTSVPSTPTRLQKYGFNQSELLARSLALAVNLPYSSLLGRHKKAVSQTKLGRKARLSNAQDQFFLRPSIKLDGKIVVIVDDVITTGATLSACAGLLKQAGAKQIWALTVVKD